jgi:hypothetical protein
LAELAQAVISVSIVFDLFRAHGADGESGFKKFALLFYDPAHFRTYFLRSCVTHFGIMQQSKKE